MQQIMSKLPDPSRRLNRLVNDVVRKTCRAAPKQPHHLIRIPAAMSHELTAIARQTGHAIGVSGIRAGDDGADFGGQLGRDALIGVDGQDPVATGKIKSAIFLRAEAWPVGHDLESGAGAACNAFSVVGAAAIQNDDFIAPLQTGQARGQVMCLVAGNQDGRNRLHGAPKFDLCSVSTAARSVALT
ncbi:hypothetical protein GALL_394190 [mine drainage metagenome]|uniref:Uncharacterized protein n=1 Tax=mine drainage metagenome TaxID=410659 RepID=A0A1J5Q586_9ZZZZ